MKELALERSPMHVLNVEKTSRVIKIFDYMKENSLERSPMNVRNAVNKAFGWCQSVQTHERNSTGQKPYEHEESGIAYSSDF